jgi:cation diffusion facilitator CzcD-associated flavoprotein CzcO
MEMEMAVCAIVGSGLAALTAYATLRRAGLEPAQLVVVGPDADPAAAWRRRAEAIRQRHMRSESDGHPYPATFPGLAVREGVRRFDVGLPLLSLFDRYRPTVDVFLAHVERVRAQSGWDESHRAGRVERIRVTERGFELDGHGTADHVLVATGHPGLSLPAELAGDPRVVHAYEPHDYAPRVAVVGAGMAAATEWLNALAAGSEVVSVRRRDPVRRPLNLPRPLFTKRGLAEFHATGRTERAALLARLSAPSFPPGRHWDEPLAAAAAEGRFRVAAGLDGVDQVIAATGFRRGFRHDPLLASLVDEHGLEHEQGWIVLDADSCVPGLGGTLALAGVPGQWAYPAADTLVGMKWAARRFAGRIRRWRTR